MLMAPFLKMSLESSTSPVTVIPAYLALEFLTKTMKLIQPVRNGLPIPTHWQFQWIVNLLLHSSWWCSFPRSFFSASLIVCKVIGFDLSATLDIFEKMRVNSCILVCTLLWLFRLWFVSKFRNVLSKKIVQQLTEEWCSIFLITAYNVESNQLNC